MQNLARTRLRDKQICPLYILPQVEAEKSQSHQEQAEGSHFAGSARPHSVHQTVTGFNAKTTTIFLSYLSWLTFEVANNNVSKAEDAFALVFAFAVFADDEQGQRLRIVDSAFPFISRGVAFAPHQQSPRAALFAAHNQGDNSRKGLLFQVGYQTIVIEAAVNSTFR